MSAERKEIRRGRQKGEFSPSSFIPGKNIGGVEIVGAEGNEIVDLKTLESDRRRWVEEDLFPSHQLRLIFTRFMPFEIEGIEWTFLKVMLKEPPPGSSQTLSLMLVPEVGEIKVKSNSDSDVVLRDQIITSSSFTANLAYFHLEIFFKPQDSLADVSFS